MLRYIIFWPLFTFLMKRRLGAKRMHDIGVKTVDDLDLNDDLIQFNDFTKSSPKESLGK